MLVDDKQAREKMALLVDGRLTPNTGSERILLAAAAAIRKESGK